jgi:triacylglycerol lipase
MRDERGSIVPWSLVIVAAWGASAAAADPAPAPVKLLAAQTYVERQGQPLRADVYQAAGPGPRPGVLVVHGGAWRAGNRNHLAKAAEALARAGYTAVAIDYRLAPKYPFPAQLDDCQAAVRWMRASAQRLAIDPERIGGYGYSAGGQLVALLGAADADAVAEEPQAGNSVGKPNFSARLQAVVAGGAPVDFCGVPVDSPMLAYWLGGTRRAKPDLYRKASPLAFASADDPPMLFFHGEWDALVPRASPAAMVAKLQRMNVPAEFHVVERKGHVTAMFDTAAIERGVKFFDKHLKGEATPKGR